MKRCGTFNAEYLASYLAGHLARHPAGHPMGCLMVGHLVRNSVGCLIYLCGNILMFAFQYCMICKFFRIQKLFWLLPRSHTSQLYQTPQRTCQQMPYCWIAQRMSCRTPYWIACQKLCLILQLFKLILSSDIP